MSIKIGTGSGAVEPSELRIASFTRPVNRVMVGIGDDAVPAYERAILPLQPMIVGSPTWAYLPDNAEYGKLAEFTVSGKGKGRFKVNVATFRDIQTNNLRRRLVLRYNTVTIASWTSWDNEDWNVIDSLSDEFDFPEDAKIEVWGELSNDHWEDRHYRWWRVEVVPSEIQDPSALIPISLWGGRIRNPESDHVVFNERMRGSGWVDIAATADMGGAFNGGDSSRYVRIRVNGTLMAYVSDRYIGRVTQEALVEEVYLEDNDLVTVDIYNGSNMDMAMYGWTVDITPVKVEEPDPAVETTTALTIDPSSVEVGDTVTLTASVTPAEATGEVTFVLDGQTYTVSLVSGVATTEVTVDTEGTFEATASFVPTSTDDFEPSSDTATLTVEAAEVRDVVKITGTSEYEARNQFRAALEDRGLHYSTVETIPFDMDTSEATNLSWMFSYCPNLTEIPEIDTSNVTTMSIMFEGCSSLTYVPPMNTSNVTNASYMFFNTPSLTDGNVLLIGKHPDVRTTQMIVGSGLTKEPWFEEGMTSTSLTITPSSVITGNPVTLTATITPPETEGVVEFLVGDQTLTADVIDGVATVTVTPEQTGEYDVTANFIPASEIVLPSSDTRTIKVTLIVTSTVLTVADEFDIGEVVPMTATVTPSEAVGEVTFTVGTQTSTVALVGGTASSTVIVEDPGLHDITAEFIPAPGANFDPSSDTVQVLAVDPDASPVVKITSTSEYGARDELRAALSGRGLDHQTVEYLPFDLDISGASNLSYMFHEMSALKEVPEMDTGHIRGMRSTFDGCSSLTEIPDLDTSNVNYMIYTFRGCSSLVEAPNIDTSKASSLSNLYINCASLVHVPDIDASSATSMSSMFSGCSSLVEAPQVYNTESVTNTERMFYGCESLTSVPDMDTSNVTRASYMFYNCSALTDGNVRLLGRHLDVATTGMIDNSGLTREPFFSDINDPAKITGTNFVNSQNQFRDALFARGLDYETVETIPFDLDTSGSTMLFGMFTGCSALIEAPEMDTSNVWNMSVMFRHCSSLEHVPDMDTSNVTDMSGMFNGCSSLEHVPDMDTSKVTNMGSMFSGCTALIEAPEMDTSNVTDMLGTFESCAALTYVPDMDTSNVTDMRYMLSGTQSLTDGNVKLFGKHPDVDTTGMIDFSGLTVEPFYDEEGNPILPAVETQTELSTDPFEVTEGGTATLRVMVSPASATGSVTFTLGGETVTVPVIDGVAATNVTVMQAGDYEVNVLFSPVSENYLPSSATGNLKVLEFVPDPVETRTTLVVVPTEITEGEQVTLTAIVSPSSAVGEVTFTVGTQTSTVPLEAGVAQSEATLEIPGDYEATAEFVPTDEADFLPSSATRSVTVIPDPVETTTTLSVVPDEIEEGELVTVTATVTPSDAAGVIEFDVAGQLSTVNVVNGEAVATATLDEAGEHAITADFVPTNEADFLPSSATSSVTVTEPAPVGLEPMEWSGGRVTFSNNQDIVEVVNYIAPGSGRADFPSTVRGRGINNIWGASPLIMALSINGVEVMSFSWDTSNLTTRSATFSDIPLAAGDVVSYGVLSRGTRTQEVTGWSFELVPTEGDVYDFTKELGPGLASRTLADGEVATHTIQNHTGLVVANITTHWTNSSSFASYHEVWKNGTRLTQRNSRRDSEQVTSTTVAVDVVPGDELVFKLSAPSTDPLVQEYDNTIITIV